jgi:hypothetical protein
MTQYRLFTDTIESWVSASQVFLEAVVKESTQEVIRLMKVPVSAGGNMPVDTSFLQNSLVGVTGSQIPPINPSADGKTGPQLGNAAGIEAVIANWQPGQSMAFGFIASYAARQNYGFTGTDSLGRNYNQSGRHFVELAAQQWYTIVERNQRRLAAQLVFEE